SCCRGRSDKCFWIPSQLFHPRLVSKNTASRERGTWIDRQYSNPMSKPRQHFAERFDECTFACSWNAGNSDADAVAGERQQLIEQFLAILFMFGIRTFQQGDRFAQVQTRTAPDPICNCLDIQDFVSRLLELFPW